MRALMEANEKYRGVTLMRADWDMVAEDVIVKQYAVPRRSTLIMFRKGKEVGRVIARTDEVSIGALFEAAVAD